MYIVLTVRRSPNLHHIFFSDGQTASNNKNISVPSLDIPKNKTATMRICFFRKKNNERKGESVNEMFKTTKNNNGNRKNRHATYNLDCNVLLKSFSKNNIINRLFFVLKNGFIITGAWLLHSEYPN